LEGLSVGIVGGGFSGTMTAFHLARAGAARVLLFEKEGRFARGAAYGSRCERHLLNVPAGNMSALPDERSHFLDWLQRRDPSAGPGTFAPRMVYGEYLDEFLAAAVERGAVELVRDEVVDVEGDARRVLRAAGGRRFDVDRVVLALGNPPPSVPAGVTVSGGSRGFVANPWSPGALDGLGEDEPILLIGAGLTAVDVVVEALARGHRGRIVAISRHGLLPQPHRPGAGPPRPPSLPAGQPTTARSLLRMIRSDVDRHQAEGGDWRAVVDGLRPCTQDLWRALGRDERLRFLRHLASRWDARRHRIAPEIDRKITEAMDDGRLEVVAGRIARIVEKGGGLAASWTRRGRREAEEWTFARVINCTGPARDVRAGAPALIRSLLDRGVARPGPLLLGLDVAPSGALIDARGVASDSVFAVGPMLKEDLWETTAVPELRSQARDLAARLVDPTRERETDGGSRRRSDPPS